MGRQIIVYDASRSTNGDISLSYLFWLAVPANLQAAYTNPSATSLLPPSTAAAWGVTPAELTALQTGLVMEQHFSGQVPSGVTQGQVETYLQNAYTAAQTAFNNAAPSKVYVGASWDGTTWTGLPA